MKYYPTLGIYKNSTGTSRFNPRKIEAFSYSWWKMLSVVKGKVIFNDYGYSVTTRKHQSKLLILLSRLRIEIDYFLHCPKGLQDLNSGIEYYNDEIERLRKEINKPRSSRTKNEAREEVIKFYQKNINIINELQSKTFNGVKPKWL